MRGRVVWRFTKVRAIAGEHGAPDENVPFPTSLRICGHPRTPIHKCWAAALPQPRHKADAHSVRRGHRHTAVWQVSFLSGRAPRGMPLRTPTARRRTHLRPTLFQTPPPPPPTPHVSPVPTPCHDCSGAGVLVPVRVRPVAAGGCQIQSDLSVAGAVGVPGVRQPHRHVRLPLLHSGLCGGGTGCRPSAPPATDRAACACDRLQEGVCQPEVACAFCFRYRGLPNAR